MLAIGTELHVERGAVEVELATELEPGRVNFVEKAGGKGPDGGECGVADDLCGTAIDTNMASDNKGGEVDGGDGAAFFVGNEGMALIAISLFFGAGQAGERADGDSKLSTSKQLLLSYRDARPIGLAAYRIPGAVAAGN